jgi:dipeptidyl aminopeptidase/acylaminoacyl peptidase
MPHRLRPRTRFLRLALVLALLAAVLAPARPAEAGWRSLTGLLPAHVNSPNFQISPDSRTVVFTADKDTDDITELYAVPITGTAAIKLNPPLVAGGEVLGSRFAFTADSQFVIYLADQEVENRVEMFRVPVGGGQAVKISPPLVAGGNVTDFKLDPDSGRVVYVADQAANEVFELWSVLGAGGGMAKLSGPFVTGGNVGIFRIDPLSDRAVYSADQETDGKYELYSVPLTGGTPVKLNPPIMLGGGGDSGLYSDWDVNPIVPVVVFIAREAGALGGRVYSIPTVGGVTPNLLSFGLLSTQRIRSLRISPLGDRVVFAVTTSLGGQNSTKGNLYSNLIGGGGAANVTETADPLFGTDNYDFLPDGSRLVYIFQNNAAGAVRLESATPLGVRAPLYVPAGSDPAISFYRFSPDSDWVMYQTDGDFLARRLYTVPPSGGNSTFHALAEFSLILPNSSRLLYRGAAGVQNETDLFSAQIFGGGQRNLSRLYPAAYVGETKASPDSQWIVFLVQREGGYELRVSDGAVAPPPVFVPLAQR